MCDQATGQGELNKRKEKVKQNEITWFDKMAVAGLGPRAVLAACCWVAVLALSHLHMLMLMIGTGKSGRAARARARAGAARNKQERLVQQGLSSPPNLGAFRALPELAQRPRRPASTACLGHT